MVDFVSLLKDKKNFFYLLLLWGISHSFAKIWYSFHRKRILLSKLGNCAGLKGHWFFGAAPLMRKNMKKQFDWRLQIMEKNKTFYLQMPVLSNSLYVYTTDSAVVKHMLKDGFDVWNKASNETNSFAEVFQKLVKFNPHGKYSSDGGKLWQQRRKVAASIFTKDNLNDLFANTFLGESKIFLQILDQNEGKAIDFQKLFFAFTMDSAMKVFFGRDTHTLTGEDDEFAKSFDDAQRSVVDYHYKSLAFLGLFDLLPWPLGPFKLGHVSGNISKLYRSLHPSGRKFNQSVAVLYKNVYKIIDSKLADNNFKNSHDLLASFMNSMNENGESASQLIEYYRQISLNLLIAGRDTTACTLTWLFYILSTNEEITKKLCLEIDNCLMGNPPTLDSISSSKMPYLNGVIYETLRLFPPIPLVLKENAVDDILPTGLELAKGTSLAYFTYGMGRDPDRYVDPLAIRPERWIPFVQPSDFEFPVFQGGPRVCLGRNMALLEVKILTCTVLQKYTFSLLKGEAEKIRPAFGVAMTVCNSADDQKIPSYSLLLIPKTRK